MHLVGVCVYASCMFFLAWPGFRDTGKMLKRKVTGTPVVHFFSTSWVSRPQPTGLAHRGSIYHCNYPVYLPYLLLVVKLGPIHQIRTIWPCLALPFTLIKQGNQ